MSAGSSSSLFKFNNDIWESAEEYKKEFKKIVFQRERYRLPFQHRSPELSYRMQIVNYMKKLAAKLKLTHCCLHLSIYLLDIFMDNHSIMPERLLLVANTCILIAAKFEEISTIIPKIKDLNAEVNNIYSVNDYKAMEYLILKFYNCYVMFPTVAHYVSYFLRALMCQEDLKDIQAPQSVLFEMHFVIRLLMDKVINDVHYIQMFRPSKLGAAVICVARKHVGLPSWSSVLEELTQYSQKDIKNELIALTEDNYFSCNFCTKINNFLCM